jgi:hypothetical protein
MKLDTQAMKHGQKSGVKDSVSTRAREETGSFSRKTEPYILHAGALSVRIEAVTDLEVKRLDLLFRQMTPGQTLLLGAMADLAIVDRGRSELADRGFEVRTFNRARIVEQYAEWVGERSRLYPYEVAWLKAFEEFGYVTSWRHALRQDSYAGADGTILHYKAGYELRYQFTLPAVFWWLMMQSNAEVRGRAAAMLASLRSWADIEPDSYQAKGE